jgi:hypothetical protein
MLRLDCKLSRILDQWREAMRRDPEAWGKSAPAQLQPRKQRADLCRFSAARAGIAVHAYHLVLLLVLLAHGGHPLK